MSEHLDPMPGSIREEDCPQRAKHTPCPAGYVAWHEWAEEKGRTHKATRCPGCNLFAVWKKKP